MYLKEQLAWAIDKQLRVIGNIKQLYTKVLKNIAVSYLKQPCMHCYVAMYTRLHSLVTYSNYFEIYPWNHNGYMC